MNPFKLHHVAYTILLDVQSVPMVFIAGIVHYSVCIYNHLEFDYS